MSKIKVFFILPTLYGGGAERVMSYIPQYINKEKFDIKLIIIGFKKDSTYEVSGIQVHYLNKSRVLFSVIPIIKILYYEKPKIVLSALTHLNILMGFISILFHNIQFIGRHCIVGQNKKKLPTKRKNLIQYIIKYLQKSGYNLLDIVLCQSIDMFSDMQVNQFKIKNNKLRIIHNPMRENFELKSLNTQREDVIKFITVARLVPIKGYERILNAISKLSIPFQYTIVGDGPEKSSIFNLIDKLGIQDKVIHIPYTSEVSKYLANNDFYLMGSYAEGFPNCLIESCSVGTPVIAFKAPGGLNEIIDDGINGFLVNTEEEFIEKLTISKNWNPEKIRESVYKKFNLKKIIGDYEHMFLEIST